MAADLRIGLASRDDSMLADAEVRADTDAGPDAGPDAMRPPGVGRGGGDTPRGRECRIDALKIPTGREVNHGGGTVFVHTGDTRRRLVAALGQGDVWTLVVAIVGGGMGQERWIHGIREVLSQCEACAIELRSVALGPRGPAPSSRPDLLGWGQRGCGAGRGRGGYSTRRYFMGGFWPVLRLRVPSSLNS
jgi:hypothetical protein